MTVFIQIFDYGITVFIEKINGNTVIQILVRPPSPCIRVGYHDERMKRSKDNFMRSCRIIYLGHLQKTNVSKVFKISQSQNLMSQRTFKFFPSYHK